jgi:hypothetical protein
VIDDPFGRTSRPPADLERADRVRLVGQAAQALLRGELPEPAARLFVAGAVLAWLNGDGRDLVRDYLRLRAPNGSRATPQAIWRDLSRLDKVDRAAGHSPASITERT